MPELPEVETVKKSLLNHLLNKKILSIDVLYSRMILTPLEDFTHDLINATIINITRIGKFLIFHFDNVLVLISHLRMEGKYYYYQENEDVSKHARIIFHLNNNEKVVYDDSRKFGIMELYHKDEYLTKSSLAKLGLEPFDMDKDYLFKKLSKSKKEIKSCLLDQTIIAGIGNIYADEILFACNINPYRKANTITINECEEIIENAKRILLLAINQGGSTISSYHPENGIDGKFQTSLLAYGKSTLPCNKCHRTLLKDFLSGRGTTYCPNCQNVAIKVGIYGKIASGKSSVLNYYKSLGYKTFSCDEYINSLYSLTSTKVFLINLFSEEVLNDSNVINKRYIKNKILDNPSLKIKLEQYFHPLVKKAIQQFIYNTKEEKVVFIEVPLMFESKCDSFMDYIIGIDADISIQLRNLSNRGSKTPKIDLQINNSNQFDKYKNKCDYIINNNSSLDELFIKCNDILDNILSR